MGNSKEAIGFLRKEVKRREQIDILTFDEYLELVRQEPRRVLRNIFQLFYDMVKSYVGEGVDDYPNDPESIGFIRYDCSRLLVEGADIPYFADFLFANRFIRQVESLRQGFQQNSIYVYEGPPGCGKSTFMNNLLRSFENYTATKAGQSFELFWEIDESLFLKGGDNQQKFIIPCPSHDYPILVIPKSYRRDFLSKLWPEGMPEIFMEKNYEWLFREEACTICKSIFESSLERLESVDKVLDFMKVRTYKFDRRRGEGISIFNPGDKPSSSGGRQVMDYFSNQDIQNCLDRIFGPNAVRYVYSHLARTNNGIYVLMDIKLYNEDRLRELHNVISEGVHKVGGIEERINSLFFALMNPEDQKILETMESFRGRIKPNRIPFVLEPMTEVKIYHSIHGESIEEYFLPDVLKNFAKVIIASRMKTECTPLKEWISDIRKYERYCDENGLLLRMDIFSDIIPDWLSEEDRKKFTKDVRRALVAEGEKEGSFGFDGRLSQALFKEFLGRYGGRQGLINMENVAEFFKHGIDKGLRDKYIPKNFLSSLVDSYDYTVLNQMKKALYLHNETQITEDILHFIWAVNYKVGEKTKCLWTGKEILVSAEFLREMVAKITGTVYDEAGINHYVAEIQGKYAQIVAQGQEREIMKTELYQELLGPYIRNLENKVLEPYIDNRNFEEAIKAYGTKEFEAFDPRLKENVAHMIKNLMDKFGYTERGAKEMCVYVLDKDLARKFS